MTQRILRMAVVAACLALASFAEASRSSSLLDLSADGRLLACANRDAGTVAVFALAADGSWRPQAEIAVGRHPEGISFIGGTHSIAVAAYADDAIVVADADTGAMTGRIDVFDEPYGVVSTDDGSRLYATLDFPGRVVEIDPATLQVVKEFEAGPHVRGIALTGDQSRVFVTEYYTAIVREIDLASGRATHFWQGSDEDNLARQIVLHPSRPKAYVPHIRSRTQVPQGAGAIFPYVAVVDIDRPEAADDPDQESRNPRRKRVQMDSFRGTFVVANPWEAAISPDGQNLCVIFSGTDDLFICRVLDDDYRELEYSKLLRTGHNPRAVRYSTDGQRLFIYNALDFTVSVLDASTLEVVQTLPAGEAPYDSQLLLGKRLFYSANQPMVGRRWISCSSCHPDGDADGRTWQQPEGLRSTQPLMGLAWTHPLHWSADRDEVQDFEHTIRGPLMQGRGLIDGEVHAALGEPNSGRSAAADALARYTNSHTFTLSPFARRVDETGNRVEGETGLSDAARNGREIFFRSTVGCAQCHSGAYYCDSRSGSLTRHDVGTGHDDPSEKMGPEYDTPTLLGLYRSAPYLHHGRAATLQDVLTTYNAGDQHGRTSQLSAAEIGDLVEFLKALPYEDPEPAARDSGLTKVEQ